MLKAILDASGKGSKSIPHVDVSECKQKIATMAHRTMPSSEFEKHDGTRVPIDAYVIIAFGPSNHTCQRESEKKKSNVFPKFSLLFLGTTKVIS